MSNYNNDPLLKIMKTQISGDDYNDPLLWWFKRIDDILTKLIEQKTINEFTTIEKPLERAAFAAFINEIYKPFQTYIENEHPKVLNRERNGRYMYTIEWHALHEYLMKNGFTIENVNMFIMIDKQDRTIYQNIRDDALNLYFNKYRFGQLLKSKFYNLDGTPLYERYMYSYIEEIILMND